MFEAYEELAGELAQLSNYYQKYARIIRDHGPALRQRLDATSGSGRVHLWRKAHNYRREMAAVIRAARDDGEQRTFLGTYFAFQVLHLHALSIHTLRRDAAEARDRLPVFHQILTRLRFQLRDLITAYLGALVETCSRGEPLDGVAFCNVGMILDQDDLDIAIFARPDVDAARWNPVVSAVGAEFFRYATKMHFYLAEKTVGRTFLTTIEDIRTYLRRGAHNFVLISELLLTERLVGDESLIADVEREIIDLFYHEQGRPRLHEGYLRGMIGEVHEQLRFDLSSPWVSPKTHGLRLIHNLTNMLKTFHDIRAHGSRETLELLKVRDPGNAGLYAGLQDVFSFIEMFFYVYQLMVSVEDTFDSNDAVAVRHLDRVAEALGFAPQGPVRPALRLLTHYYEELDRLRTLTPLALAMVNQHLQRVTVFNQITAGGRPADYPVVWTENVFLNILLLFQVYLGMIYWDDIFQLLARDSGTAIQTIMNSLEQLPEEQQQPAFERLLRLLAFDMDSIVQTAVLFQSFADRPTFARYAAFTREWLLEHFATRPGRLAALIEILPHWPATVTEFLLEFDRDQLLRLRQLAGHPATQSAVDARARKRFSLLCDLLTFSSNHYRRCFARVSREQPEIVTHPDDRDYLRGTADTLWAELADADGPEELKRRLGVYYEFGFCRCGLLAVSQPGDLKLLYGAYHEFFRRYFRWLYRACQWQVEAQGLAGLHYRERDEDDQPLAVFCSGGYAREEAFEQDLDLFVLTRERSPEFGRYAIGLINDLNRELTRRGIMPHHRLTEFFGTFAFSLDRLEEFLATPREHDFIELSLLMGSRLMIGSHSFDAAIGELLDRHLFRQPDRFIRDMLAEIDERQAYQLSRRGDTVNVREDPGALRDIQSVVTAALARIGRREPTLWAACETLVDALPAQAADLRTLERAYRFMRYFRDTYSLSQTEDDHILRDRLLATAHRMGFEPGEIAGAGGTASRLLRTYRYHRARSQRAIARIAAVIAP
ncbi:MAG TPA: hypothetical protein PK017_07460 [Acidobacteriota bacterium]|nr:hypothetical protein [Acidobacteriota bacterium]